MRSSSGDVTVGCVKLNAADCDGPLCFRPQNRAGDAVLCESELTEQEDAERELELELDLLLELPCPEAVVVHPAAGVVCPPVSVGVGTPVKMLECFGKRSPELGLLLADSKEETEEDMRKSFLKAFVRRFGLRFGRELLLGRRGSREKTCAMGELDMMFGWPGIGMGGSGVGVPKGRRRRRRAV